MSMTPGRHDWRVWAERVRLFVAGLAGMLIALAPTRAFTSKHVLPPTWDSLDGPWHIDLPWRLAQGSLSGRDFIWPYGPLFQIVHGVGLLFPPYDQASVFRFEHVGPQIVCMLAVAAVLFSIGGPRAWLVLAFTIWPLFFVMAVKPYGAIGAVALAGWAVATATHARPIRVAVIGALAAPLLTLYAFDLGLFCLVAMLSIALGLYLASLRLTGEPVAVARRNAAWLAASAVLGYLLFAVVLEILPGWGRYLGDSLQLSAGYVWDDALPTRGRNLTLLLRIAAASAAVFVACGFLVRRSLKKGHSAPRAICALGGLAVLTLGWSRYGMGRTDDSHMQVAMEPAKLLFVLALPLALASLTNRRSRWLALAIVSLALAPQVGIRGGKKAWDQARWSLLKRPFDYDPTPATLEIRHAASLRAIEAAKTLSHESLYVFPWEITVPLFAPKKNPAWTLQSIAAHSEILEEETIRRLELDPPPAMVFNTHPAIDRQPNLSRNAVLFRHLLDRYELDRNPDPEFATLRPLPSGSPDRFREEPLPISARSWSPKKTRGITLNLPANCCRANDFFWISIKSDKAIIPALGKPGRLVVSYLAGGRPVAAHPLPLVQDGESHPQLLTMLPMKSPFFFSVFSPLVDWRASEQITGIRLDWHAIDVFTSTPETITVERVSVLRRTSGEPVTLSAMAQPNAANLSMLYPPLTTSSAASLSSSSP